MYKLRLFLDVSYPLIISEAGEAILRIRGRPAGRVGKPTNCVEVYSFWRQWACLFPQHGPGPKHARAIVLADWQRALVARWPKQLLRGLVHSDGCRGENTGRNGWSHARYSFKNRSHEIHAIFHLACEALGVHWSSAPARTYISRKHDVATLDRFVGPKR